MTLTSGKNKKNVFLNWLEVHADEFELIDSLDEIHDSQSHVKCRCTKCGLIQENKTIYDYYNGKKCYCTTKGSKKPEIILNKQLEENGFLFLETYINTDTPIRAKRIACGHEFIGRPHRMFSDKNYCPLCHTYKGEEEIKSILNSKNIKYITQHKIFTYKKCFVDFFLPEFNVFIEFNGIQHFEPVEYFGGEKAFKEQLKRDKAVRIYCKENNIKLLEISYKEIDKISFILRGCLGYEE